MIGAGREGTSGVTGGGEGVRLCGKVGKIVAQLATDLLWW
ncbi:MAG: hypothetical protein JWR84_2491 [Caulobacter sp.]|nr:hypothetical protein [Caulobacter sp.]